MKKLILILLFLVYSNVFADTSEKPHIYVLHINGVNTTEDEANDNLIKLIDISQIRSNIITWKVLHNPTHGLLKSDLWDVFRQKKHESKELTINDYVETYMKVHKLSYPIDSKEYEALKRDIKNLYAKDLDFVGLNFETILTQFHQITNSVAKMFRGTRPKNAYVLLLPHSQGNLYANILVEYLIKAQNFPENHVRAFGIATPASKVQGVPEPMYPFFPPFSFDRVAWITATNDFVINSLRIFSLFPFLSSIESPLAGNVELTTCNDYLCHNLLNAYLADSNVALHISKNINFNILTLARELKIELLASKETPQIVYLDDNNDALPVHLFDPRGKLLCSGNSCMNDIFGFISFEAPYYERVVNLERPTATEPPPPYNFIFSFPGKLAKGEYAMTCDVDRCNSDFATGYGTPFYVYGNAYLENAYFYVIDRLCWHPEHRKEECWAYTSSAGRDHSAYCVLPDQHDTSKFCHELLKGACYNNRLVLGRFSL